MSEIRRDHLLRTTLDVLAAADGPMPAADVLAATAGRADLTEFEQTRNRSGGLRWETYVRYASGWLRTIDWIEKSDAGWRITQAGRLGFAAHRDDIYRHVSRSYRARAKQRERGARWSDTRWDVVRNAISLVAEGSWTSEEDLGDLIDVRPAEVRDFVPFAEAPNTHRILTGHGAIPPSFRWPDPDRKDDPRVVLEGEGVSFDSNGLASQEQRITADELRSILEIDDAPGARAWLVRGSAVSGVNVVPRWLGEGFVSIAAAHLRPVVGGIGYDDLRRIVETDYAHVSYHQRRAKLAELHAFLNRMDPGDAVATTSEGIVHLGRITGEPSFADVGDTRTTIRRTVTWDRASIDFSELPESLQSRLKSSATVVDLTDVAESVEALLGTTPVEPPAFREAMLRDLPDDVLSGLLVGRDWLVEFVELLRERRQVILYGPPGTGKTYLALAVAEALTDRANVTLVQFHPAYSYEDFFEGYRPTTIDDSSQVGFALTPGPFRKVVDQAKDDPSTPYVLIIDEINRANLAKVFGELYFLLEYRDRTIDLMYASGDEGRDFSLPKNVFIVGTMNTADRSIALVDSAMRRRFAFLSLHPDDEHLRPVLRAWLARNDLPPLAADLLEELNRRVADKDVRIGPSFLMNRTVADEAGLARIWRTAILPLLEEHHYGDEGVDVAKRYGLPTLLAALRRAAEEQAAASSPPEDGAG